VCLKTEDPERDVITPAIHGTTTILNSALKSPSVRRVVITSSELAIVPSPYTSSPPNTVYTPRFRLNPLPSAPWGNPSEVYQASKALALDASERFLAEKNPHFTVINLLPSYVIGRNELATTSEDLRKGSNNVPLSILNGVIWPTPRPAVAVYIGDVARIHVEALDEEKVKGNATFILEGKNGKEGGELVLDDAVAVAKEYFEDAVKEGILPLGGHTESAVHNMDASETVKVFGELKGYKDSVREVVEQFVELKRKELAGN
jgi:nucleoside-diphosphate-sugar epimerase